jgi:hypothetical protein
LQGDRASAGTRVGTARTRATTWWWRRPLLAAGARPATRPNGGGWSRASRACYRERGSERRGA